MMLTPLERFNAYIEIDERGCHIWTGTVTRWGYGRFYPGKGATPATAHAHRWIYEQTKGPIGDLQIDHLCRVRLCANTDHMEPVSQRKNILRGVGASAVNARKARCRQGHEYTQKVNVGRTKRSQRICVPCQSENQRQRRKVARA